MTVNVDVTLRWADQDAFGHVNSVAVIRVLEEARVRAFWSDGTLPPLTAGQSTWSLVSAVDVRYLRQLDYSPEPIRVEMGIERIGGASFTIACTAYDPLSNFVCARARVVIVTVDAATGSPTRLTSHMKSALLRHRATERPASRS